MFLGSQPAPFFFNAMDGVYAENAGAFFGGCIDNRHPEKRNLLQLMLPRVRRKCRSIFRRVHR